MTCLVSVASYGFMLFDVFYFMLFCVRFLTALHTSKYKNDDLTCKSNTWKIMWKKYLITMHSNSTKKKGNNQGISLTICIIYCSVFISIMWFYEYKMWNWIKVSKHWSLCFFASVWFTCRIVIFAFPCVIFSRIVL